MKRIATYLTLFFVVFTGLVLYNYFQAQKGLKDTKSTVLTIAFKDYPAESIVNTPTEFNWRVDAPEDFQTNYTTIFYGYVSTPSALTKSDAPEAVGYEFKAQDYTKGTYFLPFTFNTDIVFPKTGRVWFRAYVNIRGDHLWTEEKYLDVKK